MIEIDTQGPEGAEYEAWRKRAEAERDKLIAAWRAGEKPAPNEKLWKELKELFLSRVFHDKCAYCEGNYCAGHASHVEHYRPKGKVTEGRGEIDHPGYFWLAYEWRNLLLACGYCNSRHSYFDGGKKVSHPGKLNEFRIQAERVAKPADDSTKWEDELKAEQPLLLNPYFDKPADELEFDENGFLYPRNKSVRGRETIEVCDLNRPQLIEARVAEREKAENRLHKAIAQKVSGKLFGPTEQFSAWLNHCVMLKLKELSEPYEKELEREKQSCESAEV